MKIPIFRNIYRIGIRNYWLIILITLVIATISFYFAKQLRIETDFSALLPPNQQSVRNLKELKKNFGAMGYLHIIIEDENPKIVEGFSDQLVKRIESLPTVSYVDYQRPVEFFQNRKWLFIDIEDIHEMEQRIDRSLVLEKEGVSPVFSSLMDFADKENRPDLTFEDIKEKYSKKFGDTASRLSLGNEGKLVVIKIKSKFGSEDFDTNRALIAKIKEIEGGLKQNSKFKTVTLGYGGPYASSIETLDLLKKEINWVSIGVLLALGLILIIYFRQLSGAVLVGLPLIIGIIVTGGLIYFLLGRVNIITSFAVSFLAGLGSDYGIYLYSRFSKERESGKSFDEACRLTFVNTGRATFSSMLTTVGAFAALLFSGFDAFMEFGVIGCLGLVVNYLNYMLFLPSLLALAERYKRNQFIQCFFGWKHSKKIKGLTSSSWAGKIFFPRAPVWGIIPVLLFTLLSLGVFSKQSKIYMESGQLDYQNLPSRKVLDKITEARGVGPDTTVFLVKGEMNEKVLVTKLTERLKKLGKGNLVYQKVIGLSTFIPKEQAKKKEIYNRIINKYQQLKYLNPDQKKKFVSSLSKSIKIPQLEKTNLPWEVTRNFVSPFNEDTYAVYLFPSVLRGSSEEVNFYTSKLVEEKRILGEDFLAIDPSFIAQDIIKMISKEASRGFWLILGFLGLVLLINLNNRRVALLVLGHLLIGFVLTLGSLYLLGTRLNILNIAVFPIILGTGIDCFLHFYHRFQETNDLNETIRTEVAPILVSNLTTMVGFGGLIFTSHPGLESIGWVCVTGIMVVNFLCLIVFPRSLVVFRGLLFARGGSEKNSIQDRPRFRPFPISQKNP